MTPEPLAMVDLLRRADDLMDRVVDGMQETTAYACQSDVKTWRNDCAAMLAQIDGPGARWVAVDVPEMVACDHAGKHPHCDGCYVLLPHVRSEDCGLRKCDFSAVPVQCVPVTPCST
jgi:hypothetical protein